MARSLCSFPECGRVVSTHGLCDSHAKQAQKGNPLHRIGQRFIARPILTHPADRSLRLVQLTHGKSAIIDAADADAVGRLKWTLRRSRKARVEYAVTNVASGTGRRWKSLHRFLWELWGLPDTPQIDHENLDGLDCRRTNLRPATSSQNRCNTSLRSDNESGFKGVCWKPRTGKWHAQIGWRGKVIHVGYYATPAAASEAVELKRTELHGDYARAA